MVNQSRQLDYFRQLVQESLGNDSSVLVRVLIGKGAVGLRKLCAESGLAVGRVKASVLSLLHHDVVVVEEKGLYRLVPGFQGLGSLCCVRRAQHSLLVRDVFGIHGELLVDGFYLHGRLSREQAVRLCVSVLERDVGEQAVEIKEIEQCFDRMTSEEYIVRLNSPASVSPPTKKQKTMEQGVQEPVESTEYFVFSDSRCVEEHLHRFILDYVASRHSPECSDLVKLLLGKRTKDISDIMLDGLVKGHRQLSNRSLVKKCLKELSECSLPVIVYKRSMDRGDLVNVNVSGMVREARIRRTQSIIANKFGKLHARVFRLLTTERHLQMKQISEDALVSEKKCREILISLSKEYLVDVQEVPKTVDREPRNTIYLWQVHLDKVFEGILGTLYFTYVNLRKRLQHEQESNKSLLLKVSRHEDLSRDHFSEKELKEYSAYEKSVDTLEQSAHQIHESIMLFRDF